MILTWQLSMLMETLCNGCMVEFINKMLMEQQLIKLWCFMKIRQTLRLK